MEQSSWATRWDRGQIGFHQAAASHFLEKYSEQVWGKGPLSRVYVPLCGKSLDMVFLAETFSTVVGVEYVEQAVTEFFTEQSLAPDIETGPPIRYSTPGFTLFAADFFSLTSETVGELDAVFDRASLVALDKETRIRYVNHMSRLQQPGTKTLLVTFEYDQKAMGGPPFSVSAEEVQNLYSRDFEVQLLETRDVLDDNFRARGLITMTESAYVLTKL